MQLFVINLRDHSARWRATSAAFAQVGLYVERFEAVRGTALSAEALASYYSAEGNRKGFYRPLTPAEIGCYASHISLWKHMVHHNWPFVAVFEDDVVPDASLPEVLDKLERGPLDWDMVKLIGRGLESPSRRVALTKGHDLVHYRRVPSLTGGYVLSLSGANKLLDTRPPFGRPIDVDLRHWWECSLRVRGVLPYPLRSSDDSVMSTIGSRKMPGDIATRWRKLKYQGLYTWYNWRYRS